MKTCMPPTYRRIGTGAFERDMYVAKKKVVRKKVLKKVAKQITW